jgi:uncharacterized protein (DUF58 family)
MTTDVTPRVAIYGVIAVSGIIGGLGIGRPELVAIGVAAVVVLGFGLARTRDLALSVDVHLERDRAIEGELVVMSVAIAATDPIGRLEVEFGLPDGLDLRGVADDRNRRALAVEDGTVAVRVDPGETTELRIAVACNQWGGYLVGRLHVVAEDLLGMRRLETSVDVGEPLKVFPPERAMRELLEPIETQVNLGELVSRRAGEGIEYAELRPFVPGDDPRRINWRASSRRQSLWTNQRHPERNSDIVLVLDTLTGRSSETVRVLDYAVRAAASISSTHLGRRDRVGLLVMGGPVMWLRPRMFDLQRYKILDVLAESRLRAAYLHGLVAVPRQSVPPRAMLIAITPLLDEGAIDALIELVGRGHDMAIVEVVVDSLLPEPETGETQLARRIWTLQREAMRRRFRRAGVALVRWDPDAPFEKALREVASFRRGTRRARI